MSHRPNPPNFDRIARIYRWSEYLALGPLLQRTRTHFLPQLTNTRHALVLGDGDGRFLAAFFASNPQLHAVAVDISASMLHLLQQRCHRIAPGRLQTLQSSALEVTIPPDIDCIATHFFLDCLTQSEVNELAQNIAAHTQPRTLWVLSDFAIPANPVTRPLAKLYVRSLYLAFRILTGLRVQSLPNPQTALEEAGFERIARKQRVGGLLYTELWRKRKIEAAMKPESQSKKSATDALPNPEPAAPSLPGPDRGVYHHEVGHEKTEPFGQEENKQA